MSVEYTDSWMWRVEIARRPLLSRPGSGQSNKVYCLPSPNFCTTAVIVSFSLVGLANTKQRLDVGFCLGY